MGGKRSEVVVLGAGAAGLLAAMEAGRRGRRVLLLDAGERPGRKILISGGGRCNFTNTGTTAANFLSDNVHFARSALARYTPADFLTLVEAHGIAYHEKTLGQLFCDGSARQIVTMLERECGAAGVQIRCGTSVLRVRAGGTEQARFVVETDTGHFSADAVIVATGGLSIPKLGATGVGYDIARSFGHSLISPRAALVPLVLTPNDRDCWCDLAGLSVEARASVAAVDNSTSEPESEPARPGARNERTRARRSVAVPFREKLLITHRGLSGPAVLQISSYWRPGGEVCFDLAPDREVLAPLRAAKGRRDPAALLVALRTVFPARLAERWVALALDGQADWTNSGLTRLEARLHAWTLRPDGSEGFNKAEVTAGGVDTRELNAQTLESLRQPGLFFAGEVVDVTGWLGGFNFQWAWASGAAAGRSA